MKHSEAVNESGHEPDNDKDISVIKNAIPVITIDGPSGSGKGTLAKAVANTLGWHLLDSGALYRGLAYYADLKGLAFEDNAAELGETAKTLPIRFDSENEAGIHGTDILIDETRCTAALRTEETGRLASKIAAIPEVREGLLALQWAFRKAPGLVADGRDMGTVVFPDAPVKFFLTASAKTRAERRFSQLKQWAELKGTAFDVSLAALEEEVRLRDERDQNRSVAPLKPAKDSVFIDSSTLSIDEVLNQMLSHIKMRLPISSFG